MAHFTARGLVALVGCPIRMLALVDFFSMLGNELFRLLGEVLGLFDALTESGLCFLDLVECFIVFPGHLWDLFLHDATTDMLALQRQISDPIRRLKMRVGWDIHVARADDIFSGLRQSGTCISNFVAARQD